MPIDQALDLYHVRAELNRTRSGNIEGLDELVKGLESMDDSGVYLATFSDKVGREYCAFIGSETLKLAGVIKFPLRNSSPVISPERND